MIGWIIGGAAALVVVAYLPYLVTSWLNDLGNEPMPFRAQALTFGLLLAIEVGAVLAWLVI